MKSAIYHYEKGKQIEVIAPVGRTESYHWHRYSCPECGEYVTLNRLGHFVHQGRTSQTEECENRVDGVSQNIYERMGQPIFLCRDTQGVFELCIGFHPIGQDAIVNAESKKTTIIISSTKLEQTSSNLNQYKISESRFNPESYTLLHIDFVPVYGKRYVINYTPELPYKINCKWCDYADGFTRYGAVFEYGESASRKVRKKGSISTDTDYLLVCPEGSVPRFAGLKCAVEGKLLLKNNRYDIYKMNFSSCGIRDSDFDSFSNYCHDKLEVDLLIKQPRLVPLWPPCRTEDYITVSVVKEDSIFFAIDSANDLPPVYEYRNFSVETLLPSHTKSGKNYIKVKNICSIGVEKVLTVDKKFGNSMMYIHTVNTELTYMYQHCILWLGENEYFEETLPPPVGCVQLQIQLDVPGTIVQFKKNNQCSVYTVKDDNKILVQNVKERDSILIKTNYRYIRYVQCKIQCTDLTQIITDQDLCLKLKRFNGNSIKTPQRIRVIYASLVNYPISRSIIRQYLVTKRIPINALKILGCVWKGMNNG